MAEGKKGECIDRPSTEQLRFRNPDETQPTYIMRFRDVEWVSYDSFPHPYAMLVTFAEEMGHDRAWLETVEDEYWEVEVGPGCRVPEREHGKVIRTRVGSTVRIYQATGFEVDRLIEYGRSLLARASPTRRVH